MKRKSLLFRAANILFPLLAGLVVYLFLQRETWIHAFLQQVFQITLPHFTFKNHWLQSMVTSFAADMLWMYSFTFSVLSILGEGKKNRVYAFALCFSCGVILELLQLPGILSGTFDLWDIFLEGTACFMALVISYHYEKRNKIK